jgi:hypothetical protein
VGGPSRAQIDARHLRTDRWWLLPTITVVVLGAFVVYATARAVMGANYYTTPYLSPFFAPCLATSCPESASELGQPVGDWWRLSPALIILIWPLGFRMTCYYYRKAYYRSFWGSPPGCAVAEPHKKYRGEAGFPLILQNVHRYFWYVAMLFAVMLSVDTIRTFRNEDGEWGHMGFGSILFLINIFYVWLYTLSCHSCRHSVGGRLRNFSKHPVRYKLWTWVSGLNVKHARYAWISLFTLALVDFYVFMVASGRITDVRFF